MRGREQDPLQHHHHNHHYDHLLSSPSLLPIPSLPPTRFQGQHLSTPIPPPPLRPPLRSPPFQPRASDTFPRHCTILRKYTCRMGQQQQQAWWVMGVMLALVLMGCVASMKVMPEDEADRIGQVHFKRTAVSVSSSSRSSSSSSSTYSSSSRSSSRRSSSSSSSRQRSPTGSKTNSVGVLKEELRSPLPLQRQQDPRSPLQRQQESRSPLPLQRQQESRNPLPLQRQQDPRSPLQRLQESRSPLPLQRQQKSRSPLIGQQKFRSKMPKQQKFRSTLKGHLETHIPAVSKSPPPESLLSHSSSQSPLSSFHSPSVRFSPRSVEGSLARFSLSHGPQYNISSIRRERGRKMERKKSIVTEAKQADSERGRRGRRRRGRGWGEDRKRVQGGKEESRERGKRTQSTKEQERTDDGQMTNDTSTKIKHRHGSRQRKRGQAKHRRVIIETSVPAPRTYYSTPLTQTPYPTRDPAEKTLPPSVSKSDSSPVPVSFLTQSPKAPATKVSKTLATPTTPRTISTPVSLSLSAPRFSTSAPKTTTPASRMYFTPPSVPVSTRDPTTSATPAPNIFSTPVSVPLSSEVSVQIPKMFATPDSKIYFAPVSGSPSTNVTQTFNTSAPQTTARSLPVPFSTPLSTNVSETFATTPVPHDTTRSTSEPFSTPASTNVPEMFLTPAPHPTQSYTGVSMPLSLQALVPLDPSTAPSALAPLFLASHLASQITTMKTGLDHGQDWISLRSSPLLDEPQTNPYSTYGQIRRNSKENRGHRIKFTSGVNQSYQDHDQAKTNTTPIQMGSGIQIRVQGMSPRPIIPPSTQKDVVQDELPQQQQQLLKTLQQQNELQLHDHGGTLYNVQFWPSGGSESRSSQTNKHDSEGKAGGGKVGGDKGHKNNNNERETEKSTRSKEVIIITGKKVLESYVPSSLPTPSSSPSKKAQGRKVAVERRLGSSKNNISTLQPWKTILTSQPQGKIPISQPQRSQTLTSQPQRKKTSTSQPGNQTSTSREQLQNSTSSFPPSKTITRHKGEGNSMKGKNRGLRRYKKHLLHSHRPLHVLHGPPYDHYQQIRASLSPDGTFSSIFPPPPPPLRRQKAYQHYNTVTNKPQDERYLVSGSLKSEPLLPTLPLPPTPPSFGNQMAYPDYHNNYHALKVKADVDESLFASESLKSKLKPTISLQPYFSEESPHKHQHSHRRHSFPSTAPRTTHFSKLPPSPLSPPIPRTTTLSPVRLSPTKRPSIRFLPTTLPPPQLTTSTMLRIRPYPTPRPPPQLPTSPPPRIIPHLTPLPTHPTSHPPPPPRIQHPTSRRPTSIPTRLLHPSSHPTSLPPRLIRHPTSLLPHLTPLPPPLPLSRHMPPSSPPPLDIPYPPTSTLPPLPYPPTSTLPPLPYPLPPLPYPTSTLPPPLLHLTSTFPPLPYPTSTIPPRPPPPNPEAADSLGSSVIGKAWVDYPAYATIPRTNFTCTGPGLYADTQAGCQVWHICEANSRRHSFLCPNGTIFSQHLLTCDWWHNVHCSSANHIHHHLFGQVLPQDSHRVPDNKVLERVYKQPHGEVGRVHANRETKDRSVLKHERSKPVLTTPTESKYVKLDSESNLKPPSVLHIRSETLKQKSIPVLKMSKALHSHHIKGKRDPRVIYKTPIQTSHRPRVHHNSAVTVRPSTQIPVVKGRVYPLHSTSRPRSLPSVPFREFVPYVRNSYPMFHINRNYRRQQI
ncbi:hypothetical protein Pmani_003588 [Petrolisthes manimaculis]|uniref:Chitin-binding type-2 domain-containing protein n=1 Tax=Petrolisthes manimaculis TaxID=1843537 RepID=A0AAE1QG69_9EUCA|nr:hypothetical protein Pmani_003588 [Petrolisthes manimaculis]